jgi:hypothetical protein
VEKDLRQLRHALAQGGQAFLGLDVVVDGGREDLAGTQFLVGAQHAHGLEGEAELLHEAMMDLMVAKLSGREENSFTPCRRNLRRGSCRVIARSSAGFAPFW